MSHDPEGATDPAGKVDADPTTNASGGDPHGVDEPEHDATDPDEFFVTRDPETGEVRPVWTTAEGFGDVQVRPMNYGQAESYFGDAGQVANVGPSVVAQVLRSHVVEPDLNEYAKRQFGDEVRANSRGTSADPQTYMTETVVREHMTPFAPQALLMAIMRESGLSADISVGDDGTAQIQFDDEGN